MTDSINKLWFRQIFRGGIILIFSLFILLKSVMVPFGLAYLLGMIMIFSGSMIMLNSVNQSEETKKWWVQGIEGLFDLVIGISILSLPNAALLFISIVLASWSIFAVIYFQDIRKKVSKDLFTTPLYAIGLLILFILINLITPLPGISSTILIILAGVVGLLLSGAIIFTGLQLKKVIRR